MRNGIAAFAAALALACPAFATVTGNPPPSAYSCNGTTTTYTIPWPYLATSNVVATVTTGTTVTPLALTTDFTVSPSIAPSVGTLTLVAGSRCPNGSTLTLTRNVPLTQPQSFRTGPYSGAAHEQALDRGVMEIQDTKAAQATKDAAQDLATVNVNSAVAALNTGSHSVGDTTSILAFGSTTPRTLTSRFVDGTNAKDWGAVGNGGADDSPAINAAAAVGGGRILLPCPGTYKATLTGVANSSPYSCGIFGSDQRFDSAANGVSMLSLLHNGAGGSQTYGVDIHNYPDNSAAPTAGVGAHSALAIHQYSDRDQAVQIDQVRSAGMLIMRLTHNETLATGQHGTGPYIDFVGYTAGKPYPANQPVLMGRLEGGSPGTPLFFSSKETDTPWGFRSDTTAPSLKITQTNAGIGLQIATAGTSTNALSIAHSAASTAVNISGDSNTSGFFPMIVTGYSHGPKFTTTINSGPALTLQQTVAGGNQVLFIDNRGAGSSVRLSSDGSNTTYSVSPTGSISTTSSLTKGNCTLNGASPSTCAVGVLSGATCTATGVGTTAAAAIPVAVNVVGTVLTVTAANGATNVINYICLG